MSGININLPVTFEQKVVFQECRHNHAASLGCIAYDGCYAFLKPSDDVNGGPATMLCLACGCHRNFHRRDIVYNPIMTTPSSTHHYHHHHQPDFSTAMAAGGSPASATRDVQLINHETTKTMHAPPPPSAFENINNNVEEATAKEATSKEATSKEATTEEATTEDAMTEEVATEEATTEEATAEEGMPPARKRKRTMFTAEQRNRMVLFAERLGWRPQKADKEEIHEFCMDMGISRRMFLVWLNNNRRRVAQPNTAASTA